MIKIVDKKTTKNSSSLPEFHYFTGRIGDYAGLFAKVYGGELVFMGNCKTVILPPDLEIENYRPVVKMIFKPASVTVTIREIPSGTYFTGKTSGNEGLFLKLPTGGYMMLDRDNLNYIPTWGDYARNNIVTDYKPVELNLTVETE